MPAATAPMGMPVGMADMSNRAVTPRAAFSTGDPFEPATPPPPSMGGGGAGASREEIDLEYAASFYKSTTLFSYFNIRCCGRTLSSGATKKLLGGLGCAVVLLTVLAIVTVSGGAQDIRKAEHRGRGRGGGGHAGAAGAAVAGAAAEEACYSYPCRHGGTCAVAPGNPAAGVLGYQCACPAGYAGAECLEQIDECATQPCLNGGLCVDEQAKYECNCRHTGHYGTTCSLPVQPCGPQQDDCDRRHGQCYSTGPGAHVCDCDPGWGGDHCSQLDNLCLAPNPCEHNSTCVNLINDYMCECPRGYGGENCGQNILECSSNPCNPRGTARDDNGRPACVDGVDSYACVCAVGWAGDTCNEDVNECANEPCLNGGQCDDSLSLSYINQGFYRCSCIASWYGHHYTGYNCDQDTDCSQGQTGSDCTTDVDECVSVPCVNGGTCYESSTHGPVAIGFYQCECPTGYFGENCGSDEDECASAPCGYDGTCFEDATPGGYGYTCQCEGGWAGQNCAENLHECGSNPCMNEGTCIDQVNAFACLCGPHYLGDRCQTSVVADPCSGTVNPCNNGTCLVEHGVLVCDCRTGYDGDRCMHIADVGWGASVDMTRVHSAGGQWNLLRNPIFSDSAHDMIQIQQLDSTLPRRTHIFGTMEAWMQEYALSLGAPFAQGEFSQDTYMASIRQQTFSSHPNKKVLGNSRIVHQAYENRYRPTLPLHSNFLEAIQSLPNSIDTEDQRRQYLHFLDRFGSHYVSAEIYGGALSDTFFVPTLQYATQSDAVMVAAREHFASDLNSSLLVAADNAQTSLPVAGGTARLQHLHFSVKGGELTGSGGHGQDSGSFDRWVASIAAHPVLVDLELEPIGELLAAASEELVPGAARKGGFMQTMVYEYFRTCLWVNNLTHSGSRHPMCSNRGTCEFATGACNCDPGFYPSELDGDDAPCSLFYCPRTDGVECSGHGECNKRSGICTCDSHWDGPSCESDIDECQDLRNHCIKRNRVCINTPGSFECGECLLGYSMSVNNPPGGDDVNMYCDDVDECAGNSDRCGGLPCYNEVGTYRCGQCEEGYQPIVNNTLLCEDIDECLESNNECAALFEDKKPCINTNGSYTCGECINGYSELYSGFCDDVDECEVPANQGYCTYHAIPISQWANAQSEGVLARGLNDDDDFEMPLPFRFPYYSSVKETVHVSSNGYLFFTGGTLSYGETTMIPSRSIPNDIVAPYWTDLDPSTCGSIYTISDPDRFVVEWVDIPYFSLSHSCGLTAHFEAILHKDGSIDFLYDQIEVNRNYWAIPTVGLENADGSEGLYVAYCFGNCPPPVTSSGGLTMTPCSIEPGHFDPHHPAGAEDLSWEYPCPPHAECSNTNGAFGCICDDGFGNGNDCTPTVCTQGILIPGSDRDALRPCSGSTGDVCDYVCPVDAMKVGQHICQDDGVFRGGMCIAECHTVQIEGDCFHGYDGLYNLSSTVNGQPVYLKHDDYPDDKIFSSNSFGEWEVAIATTPGQIARPPAHGTCGDGCLATNAGVGARDLLASVLGTHVWQTRCTGQAGGGMEFMSMHMDVTCMVLCSNACATSSNGICEDGGVASRASTCHYGTDCRDCGNRDATIGSGCEEPTDNTGFTCNDYIQVGYSCFEMVSYYAMDCSCSCSSVTDSVGGRRLEEVKTLEEIVEAKRGLFGRANTPGLSTRGKDDVIT